MSSFLALLFIHNIITIVSGKCMYYQKDHIAYPTNTCSNSTTYRDGRQTSSEYRCVYSFFQSKLYYNEYPNLNCKGTPTTSTFIGSSCDSITSPDQCSLTPFVFDEHRCASKSAAFTQRNVTLVTDQCINSVKLTTLSGRLYFTQYDSDSCDGNGIITTSTCYISAAHSISPTNAPISSSTSKPLTSQQTTGADSQHISQGNGNLFGWSPLTSMIVSCLVVVVTLTSCTAGCLVLVHFCRERRRNAKNAERRKQLIENKGAVEMQQSPRSVANKTDTKTQEKNERERRRKRRLRRHSEKCKVTVDLDKILNENGDEDKTWNPEIKLIVNQYIHESDEERHINENAVAAFSVFDERDVDPENMTQDIHEINYQSDENEGGTINASHNSSSEEAI